MLVECSMNIRLVSGDRGGLGPTYLQGRPGMIASIGALPAVYIFRTTRAETLGGWNKSDV